MLFLLYTTIFYSILSTGLLIRNHYRYEQVLKGIIPEYKKTKEHVHEWNNWAFKETTNIYSGTDSSKVKDAIPVARKDRYFRICKTCGEPEYKILKQ